jgi:hypothetical protein
MIKSKFVGWFWLPKNFLTLTFLAQLGTFFAFCDSSNIVRMIELLTTGRARMPMVDVFLT